MFLIPYKTIRITSSLTPEEASRRITQVVDTRRWTWRRLPGVHFQGRVSPEGFRILPVVRGRNTYLPLIRGYFHAGPSGTDVVATFSLHPLAIAMVSLLAIVPFAIEFFKLGFLSLDLLTWLALLFALHVLLYFTGFLPEARRAETFLRDLLGK
jgi:hypothetical protein